MSETLFSNVVSRKYICIEIMTVYIVKVSQITCTFATLKYNCIKEYQLLDMYVPDFCAFSFLKNCCVSFVWYWHFLKIRSQVCTACMFCL